MSNAKIAVSLDSNLLKKVDYFVEHHVFKNRSQAIQIALDASIKHIERRQLIQECAKLDVAFETRMAEEGLSTDTKEW